MLNMKTSSNRYDLSARLLKLCNDTCSKYLLHILNNCISDSIFDNKLKYANITPIHDDPTEKSNYHPVTVLPIVSKLFDRIL